MRRQEWRGRNLAVNRIHVVLVDDLDVHTNAGVLVNDGPPDDGAGADTDGGAAGEVLALVGLLVVVGTHEHVGNFKNQVSKIKNMISLSNRYLVISTPNRFYPIELHTKLPLIHWLPKKIFRKIIKGT